MNTHGSIYKRTYLVFVTVLGLTVGSLSACTTNTPQVDTTNTASIKKSSMKMVSKATTTQTASISEVVVKENHTETPIIVEKSISQPKLKKNFINYQSKKFHSNNKMVLLDSKKSKVSIPTIKEKYLYKDVSELISTKGKPDYFLREINSGVLRYTINNCPVIFFVVREKKTNRIDNIKSVCETTERVE